MKSWVINCSLLIAVCCSSYMYTLKFSMSGIEDRLIKGLAGVHPFLETKTPIVLRNYMPPERTNAWQNVFSPDFLHFVLAPVRIVDSNLSDDYKTLLILPANCTDSLRRVAIANATVIWENADTQFSYILTQ